ncbi:DNA mismatch repair endonuclease MutL [Paenibacillus sp. ACRRX]|uniref:DNA mismatch repair endonuclease MutL n=1 Tax=Paenibacillus sp. ACRRX TaxID=2918206 RepID=UPI001EF5CF19|nr:DNA mismatch repair endonuclease MutL [Paenibacillus sp. ACRRX]MCG7406721.1 DNA mismatch repair endonuclease MutL [Paenibacillus sp. ACRRX]
MAIIHVLDDQLANQIAAGEVVERPASVVKELVENAIDAGSRHIDVVVEEGGLQLIQVKDNGSGIAEDDVETAFERHATSKIRSNRDLFSIRSLGFRGEALPSIAAVAKVEVVTSTESTGLGRRIVIEGGHLLTHEPAQSMQGTTFTIRELFYNTPARLKYMKTIQTELGHISDLMYRLALSYPEIGFSLKHNENMLLQTLGNGDLLQVIAAVYGVHTAKQMIKVKAEHLDYDVEGYIGKPELTRSNRNAMSWFVNGRYVRSFPLNQAALRAYHTLLPINRYPVIVMQVKMHPTLVDVNVHPSKMEVRFSKETELSECVELAFRQELVGQTLIPKAVPTPKAKVKTYVEQAQMDWAASTNEQGIPMQARGSLVFHTPKEGNPTSKRELFPDADHRGAAEAYNNIALPDAKAEEFNRPNKMEIPNDVLDAASPQPAETEHMEDTALQAADVQAEQAKAAEDVLQSAAPISTDQKEAGDHGLTSRAPVNPDLQREHAANYEVHRNTGAVPDDSALSNRDQGSQVLYQPTKADYVHNRQSQREERTPVNRTTVAAWNKVMEQSSASDAALPPFPALSYLGSLHGTYLICGNEEGLYLIDQHAAHERVNYEYYVDKFGKPIDAFQELLIPLTIELTPNEAGRIRERMPLLEHVGIAVEPFGAQTFLIRSHPYWFPNGEEEGLIQEMMDWVLNEKAPNITTMREASAIMCSCKASIKANQRITQEEADMLIARLGACRQPFTCPHGRPIIIKFTNHDLEKMFKRIM